ncbi:MAG: EAL domain-containing protein [Alphaproteobacteria bacterium]|nr:EAL domain-containing protein [Alphaproteobacteria bacterium]
MSDSKSFSYANVVKNLPFIAFVRTKTAKGKYSYEFPTEQDKDALDFSQFDEILTDAAGCLDIVRTEDRENLARAIEKSAREMTVSEESFGVILPSGETRWLIGGALPQKKKNGDIVWSGLWLDATAEKKRDFFDALVVSNSREGIVAFDQQGQILSFSPSLANILSCPVEDISSKSMFSLLPADAVDAVQQYMLMPTQEKTTIEFPSLKEDGTEAFFEIDLIQKNNIFVCLFRDVTEYHKREEKLRYLAYHDIDTGVENYSFLKDAFDKALEQSRVSQTQIAVLSIALDSLGQLNALSDQSIHARVIAAMAERFRACLQPNDVLAQVSSYRFTILITELEFALGLEKKIEAILHSLNRPIIIDDMEFDLSISIGVCFCPQDGEKLEDLIYRADLALEKGANKPGTLHVYNSDLSIQATINLNMRRNLKKALENDEIKAFFQPQVDIKTGRIVGMEALARWVSSDGGVIPPSEFLSEAEEYGLIDALTEVILKLACQRNQKWYSAGLCCVPVAVNISGRQFHNETHLLSMVDKALEESDLPPYLLELELTESSAMYDPENAKRIIRALLDNNIRCALDDFGTGYSSLGVLRSFPLKKLKIDRSFILELDEHENLEIVRATIAMAHALNLTVLAEGVEARRHFNALKDLGCDIIQGYLFSRPLPPKQMELMLSRWNSDAALRGEMF